MPDGHNFELVNMLNVNGSNDTGLIFFQDPDRDLFIQCHQISYIFSNYVYPSIGLIGCILNSLCIWVFSDKKFSGNNSKCAIFKYLLVKSIYDLLILLFNVSWMFYFQPYIFYKNNIC